MDSESNPPRTTEPGAPDDNGVLDENGALAPAPNPPASNPPAPEPPAAPFSFPLAPAPASAEAAPPGDGGPPASVISAADEALAAKSDKKKKKDKQATDAEKEERSRRGRGVETLFRTSYAVNMDLTALADAKANIMVSVNGLMITVLVGSVAPGIDTNRWLIFPTAVLLAGITTALVLGVLAARPRVESRVVNMDDIRGHRANLLFFGHFANITRDEFVAGMRELMDQPDEVYRTMSADLYGIGSVLQRKYRLLRASYLAFLIGIALGVGAFVGTFIFNTPDAPPDRVIIQNPAGASAPALRTPFTPQTP